MRYFFIAGEPSGDQHASQVIARILDQDPAAEIQAWGGPKMELAGAKLLKSYDEFSIMGFWEVVTRLKYFRQLLEECKVHLAEEKPDVLVLVDFGGFNLRVARLAKQQNIKTCYYIPPKIWAWAGWRIKRIKKYIDQLLVIFPFEESYYRNNGYKHVQYVGNPSLEQINAHRPGEKQPFKKTQKNVALLPGSRKQEILSVIEVLEPLIKTHPEITFLVAGVKSIDQEYYDVFEKSANVKLYFNKTYDVLKGADAAIVTSGTATLETALLGVPQVAVYKTSWISYWIARVIVKVNYISLVNLIADKAVISELIQSNFNVKNLALELDNLFNNPGTKKRISEGYSEILNKLGNKKASLNAAKAIIELSSS